MDEPTTADIEALQAEVRRTSTEYHRAKCRLDAALCATAEFKPGDIVEVQLRGVWQPAIVRSVEVVAWGLVWYRVSILRQNGEWGKRVQHAFDGVRRPQD